jgi:vacuolar-type H+-ATPase subunit E/Vma4
VLFSIHKEKVMDAVILIMIGAGAGGISLLLLAVQALAMGSLNKKLREDISHLSADISSINNRMDEDTQVFNRSQEVIEKAFEVLQKQVDAIESDLERAKLSSLTQPATIKSPKGKVKVNAAQIKAKNIEQSVLHLTSKKQGGKRANKSRSR